MEVNTNSNRSSSIFPDSTLLYFLAFVGTFLFCYPQVKKLLRHLQLAAKIPGPNILTNAKLSLGTFYVEPHDVFKCVYEVLKNYKDIAKMWLGPKLVIFLYNPEDVEIILSSSEHIDKSTDYGLFRPWFGNGLLISSGDKWKHHRKMIAPTFHQSILKSFVTKFYNNSLNVCDRMQRENGKTFDCHDYMSTTTVDILLDTAMGFKTTQDEKTSYNYAMAVMKLSDLIHRRHYKLWLRSDYIFSKTKHAIEHSRLLKLVKGLSSKVAKSKYHELTTTKAADLLKKEASEIQKQENTSQKIIKEKISGYNYGTAVRDDLDDNDDDVGEKKRLSFLEQLTVNSIREDVDFTQQEVVDQVNTIMFEGHDTTAAGSSFALCVLGANRHIQEKVIQEIDEIFDKSDRACAFADTTNMHYLERVIMETLRMYPPVPIIAREVRKEVKLASGDYILPEGTTIVIAQAVMHRRADLFPNPDVFNPDNFLPEKCQERHFYSYIPFSAGPRSCVGRKFAMLKLKVLLSTIFRKYRVCSDIPEADFKLQADVILKIAGGFNIRLEPRKDVKTA